jgi:EmrB/QacA subfamily drug resistance transporter
MFSRVSRPMIVALIVACALFMENLDGTIITTALPAMARSFGDSAVHLSLGVTAYMLSLAVFIPASGWAADRYGSRTIFRAAIAVFMLGSIFCGFSNNLAELASARVLQGIGGAMMVPVGRLVLLRSVEKSEIVRAMAYLTTPAMVGPLLGPPVGGFITTYLSWRWVFFLNLPIGILGIVLVSLLIENHREAETKPLDWRGLLYTGGALGSLLYGFDLVGHPVGRSAVIWGLLGIGVAVGIFGVRHARRHAHPLIDLTLLRVQTFAVTIWGGSLYRVSIGAFPFLLPLMLQVGFGLTAFASGLLTFGAAAGSFAMKVTARRTLRRFGFRTVFIGNGLICAVSVLVCALFTPATPAALIFALLMVGGFFRSLQYTSLNAMAYADITTQQMSAATSFSSMMQQLSNGMGVALGALVLQLAVLWRATAGATPTPPDFALAFLAVGLLSLISIGFFLRLTPNAGAEVSGHGPFDVRPDAAKRMTASGD